MTTETKPASTRRAELLRHLHQLDPDGQSIIMQAIVKPNLYNTTEALMLIVAELARRADEMDERFDGVDDRLDDVESWRLPADFDEDDEDDFDE